MPVIRATPLPADKFVSIKEINDYIGEKLIARIQTQHECETNPIQRLIVRAILEDPDMAAAFFINNFCWTADPRKNPVTGKKNEEVPFLLYPAQEEAANFMYKAITEEIDSGIFKPRDLGLTWIMLCVLVLLSITKPNHQALISSHVKEMNDHNNTPAELFWKLDFIIDRLPRWLLGDGYDKADSDCRMKNRIYFPDTGSIISSRAPTDKFGVGDRQNVTVCDDWGRWEVGFEAWDSAADTTNCRFVIYTVNENDPMNHVWEYDKGIERFEGVERTIFELDWQDDLRKRPLRPHPVTGEPCNAWMLRAIGDPKHGIKGRSTKQQFTRSYLKDFEANTKGRIYGVQMVDLRKGEYPFLKELLRFTEVWYDFGIDDSQAIVTVQWDYRVKRYRAVRVYENNGYGIRYYIPLIKGLDPGQRLGNLEHFSHYGQYELEIIEERTSWQVYDPNAGFHRIPYFQHSGDPYGNNRDLSSGHSAMDVLAEADIIVINNTKKVDHASRIEATRLLLPYLDIDAVHCERVHMSLNTYKFGVDGKTPVHDKNGHIANAVGYGAVNSTFLEEIYRESNDDVLRESPGDRSKLPDGVSVNSEGLIGSVRQLEGKDGPIPIFVPNRYQPLDQRMQQQNVSEYYRQQARYNSGHLVTTENESDFESMYGNGGGDSEGW